MDRKTTRGDQGGKTQAFALMTLIYLVLVVQHAWTSDDAYITLRTADNLVHGFGPTYNLSERVQAYTHPLWFGVVSLVYAVTGATYLSLIVPAICFSVVAFYLAVGRQRASLGASVSAAAALVFSQAFVDYSTSGLENSLTHLLLGSFFVIYFRADPTRRTVFYMALVAGLGMMNRMDTALLFLPALLAMVWRLERRQRSGTEATGIVPFLIRKFSALLYLDVPWFKMTHADPDSRNIEAMIQSYHEFMVAIRRGLTTVTAGLIPFFAWELFSLVYYGFPFPNTAYAKLNTGLPRDDLLAQGCLYFVDSIFLDPVTLFVIVGAVVSIVIKDCKPLLPPALGISFYLAYVLWIGGDFMSGRFFAAPLYVAAVLFARQHFSDASLKLLLAAILILGLGPGLLGPGLLGPGQGPENEDKVSLHGIVDERSFYRKHSSLTHVHRYATAFAVEREWPGHEDTGAIEEVVIQGAVGLAGFETPPEKHIVDFMGLTDPLLSKLPMHRPFDWRIGHFLRKIPAGYLETLQSGENQIQDEDLARYYDHLSLIVRGELFSFERFATIVRMNLGLYDHLIDEDFYRRYDSTRVKLAEISRARQEGTPTTGPDSIRLAPRNGLFVELPAVHHGHLALGMEAGVFYELVYFRGGEPVVSHDANNRRIVRHRLERLPGRNLGRHAVRVPRQVMEAGYDGVLIFPVHADGQLRHSVVYVKLRPR